MDPANKGYEFVVDITTTPDLAADQREIGNFLRNNYSRLHHLKISGDRAFHLNLVVTGNTIVNLKAERNDDDDADVTWKNNLDALPSWTESDSDDDDGANESDDGFDSMAHSSPLVGFDSQIDSQYDDVEFTQAY